MLKIYIAAPYPQAETAEKLAQVIQKGDWGSRKRVVISRWHRIAPVQSLQEAWLGNMLDLENADLLIALTFPTGGREMFVEIGLHLSKHRRIFWHHEGDPIEQLSLMHNPDVQPMKSWDEITAGVGLASEYGETYRPFRDEI